MGVSQGEPAPPLPPEHKHTLSLAQLAGSTSSSSMVQRSSTGWKRKYLGGGKWGWGGEGQL